MPDLNGPSTFSSVPEVAVREAVGPSVGADPDSGHSDFGFYRQLGQTGLDLSPMTQERMQALCLNLYVTNPYAYRIVRLKADFAVGGGIRFDAEDKRVLKVMQEHWNHPLNDWERAIYDCAIELSIFGEIFQVANVISPDNDVTWGALNPTRVKAITPDDRDVAHPAFVHVIPAKPPKSRDKPRGRKFGNVPSNTIPIEVIRYDGKPRSKTRGFREGKVMMTKTNSVRGAMRGISDLFTLVDYLDSIDKFMFANQQRAGFQNNFIWDVKLEGMSETEIREWLNSVHGAPPAAGSIRAHNERVEWKAVAPELAASEIGDHMATTRGYILGGAGLADWIIGDMSSANRSATENSAAVISRGMETRQKEIKLFLTDVFNFVIDKKIQAGELPKRRKFDRRFYISMPKINIRDYQRVSNSLRQSAEALSKLKEAEIIDDDRTTRLANEILNQLDLEGVDRNKEGSPTLEHVSGQDYPLW